MKVDNLSLVIKELNENEYLDKKLTREQVSSMKYSEIKRLYNLNCDSPSHSFFRNKGKLNPLFNFKDPEKLTKRILKKIKSLLKK